MPRDGTPQRILGLGDGVALTVGMVVGIGVFKAPSLVAARIDDPWIILGLWAVGALVMLIGALTYAELAARAPDAGGEYHFLSRAFGPAIGFLFAWGRFAVVQTGAIAAVAFVLGDYFERLAPLGPYGPAIYGAGAVVALTGLNARGTQLSAAVQNWCAACLVAAVLAVAVLGFVLEAPSGAAVPGPDDAGAAGGDMAAAIGFAMIFVMLTYGGWNEAAYLSAELRHVRLSFARMMTLATLVVAVLYLALNAAYLKVLGVGGLRASEAVGADYMAALLGPTGGKALSALVVLGAVTTLNATIFTGARSGYAMGRDMRLFAVLGRWSADASGPVTALLVQGAIALALIIFGAAMRGGFTAMIEYTAPVFWFFLLLTGAALFVFRHRRVASADGAVYRVPLYPVTPLLFCMGAAYMLHASLVYTGAGALLGAAVVLAGVPIWLFARARHAVVAQ